MTNQNDSAFAAATHQKGLTKREYFAAMAMQGLMTTVQLSQYFPERIASESVMMADALINALNDAK